MVDQRILQVVLDTPVNACFDYLWTGPGEALPQIGQLVKVPFGKREAAGMIVAIAHESLLAADKLKDILDLNRQLPPLSQEWLELCRFAAEYYQRPLGEVALPALPKNLRSFDLAQLERAYKKLKKAGAETDATARPKKPGRRKQDQGGEVDAAGPSDSAAPDGMPVQTADMAGMDRALANAALPNVLTEEQAAAVEAIAGSSGFAPILLYGVTGAGKTEVYLQAAKRMLESSGPDQAAQALILVPEINLTPQLEGNVRSRLPDMPLATLHSGLAEGERMQHWLAAHQGTARIVLGTRLAVMASMPNLKLIIVDEEHDPSYKQQEGLRYSARDLAVWRARQLGIPVVLGSATPSLETWHHAQSGRYRLVGLRQRAVKNAVLPGVRLIDMERDKPAEGMTSTLVAAIRARLERREQSLLFLNRRGYAPVLHCDACGWISNCRRCTSFMVVHKQERRLRCHHCSLELAVPRSCPTCGNIDLQPLGRGTQRIEEGLQHFFPQARILRIDADSTRRKGSAQAAFEQVHRGEVDILIGTQMVAKGHDFKNLTLVGVLNPDTALFSHDYRASERLFAQLMQVSGRAGRMAQKEGGNPSEVLIQTRYPHHPLYGAVISHDYDRFASLLLEERSQAGLPPFVYQAMLRAEARELQAALEFLGQAAVCLDHEGIIIHDPIPMAMTRIANQDRAQLLVESASRPRLQAFLKEWVPALQAIKSRARWTLEVDPLDI